MKTILAFLLSCPLAFSQTLTITGTLTVGTITNSVPAGGGGVTYLVKQGFEGTGFDNSESWSITETAGPNIQEDYTGTVLDGSQSFFFTTSAETASATITYTASSNLWLYMMLRVPSLPAANSRILYLKDAGGTEMGQLLVATDGTLIVRAGSSGVVSTTDALTAGVTYHVWFAYAKGTGANAVASVGFATTAVEPTSGTKFASHTTGDATANASKLQLGQDGSSSCTWICDKVRLKTSVIGDSPE